MSEGMLFRIVWASCWVAVVLIGGPVFAVIVGRRLGWTMLQKYAAGMGIVAIGVAVALLGALTGLPH